MGFGTTLANIHILSIAIVPCGVNQTHLKYFKWPGSTITVSHILHFIALEHSLCINEGKKQGGRRKGMQQWPSHDLPHSTGGLCKCFWSQYERLEKDTKRPAKVRADPDHR